MKSLPPDDPRHGTMNAYGNFGCRCENCYEAAREYRRLHGHSQYKKEWNWRKGLHKPWDEYQRSIEPPHGTESRYSRCRCGECREAARVARARRRANEKAAA